MKQWKMQKLHDTIAKQVANQNFAKIGKVTTVKTGGLYDVELSSGDSYTDVTNLDFTRKWSVGDWVTLEFYGGDWAIVGRSAYKGGD